MNISLDGAPNKNYEKLFEKFNEISTLDVSKWNATHILGYFCKKYQEHYNVAYKFKFNSPVPSKCFEVFQVKKLSMHLSKDPEILKSYIDFMFQTKAKSAKRRLTSISFLTDEDSMIHYKMNHLLTSSIDRSTELPDNYKKILADNDFPARTYGELAFIKQASTPETAIVLEKLAEAGFDESILENL